MLQALGGELLDKSGKQVPFGAEGVEKLASISCKNLLPELKECSFRIACDVDNPLYGEKGCSYIFGPQKGATPEMVELMDGWMENYAKITEEYFADSKTQLGNLIMIQTTQAAEQPEALALPSVLFFMENWNQV